MTRSPTPRPRHAWRTRRLWLAAAPLLLLAACGGGSSEDAGNTNSYDLDDAITRNVQTGLQVSGLTATNGAGTSFTLSFRYLPQADAVFEGASRRAVRQTLTISGGGSTETTGGTLYYSTAPYTDVGSVGDDGSYSITTSTGRLPTAARVGSSGPLSTDISYTSSSKTTILATTVSTWALEADTERTALACQVAVITETGSSSSDTVKLCWRINTAGQVLGGQVTVTIAGVALVFR